MASEVEISNLALAHLGDSATVASLDPPEGSAQAEHCARFYPIARDALFEMHTWNFSTRRITLAQLTNDRTEWAYMYARPNGAIKIFAVLPEDAEDDYAAFNVPTGSLSPYAPAYAPQPFATEIADDGTQVIYTNVENATARYAVQIEDTTKFSPLFVMALSHFLASMLAGPVLKGDAGAAEGKRQLQLMEIYLARAKDSDSNQRQIKPAQRVGWIAGR